MKDPINMTDSRPILCGMDFSENAKRAANAAAALAVRAHLPLLLVHVADEFNGLAEMPKKLPAFLRPIDKKLQIEAKRLRKAGAEVETELLHGSVAENAILEWVKTHPVALVVVSSVSKTAFDRWTLGSVSECLAKSVASPTLVVRDAAPFEAWGRGERALKVFVATDFASVSEAPLCWVAELRKLGPCEVTVAQVDRPMEERERLGVGAMTFTKNSPPLQQVLERDLRKKVLARFGGEPLRVIVEPSIDQPDVRLIELATSEQADVIVVGTHRRLGFSRLGHHSVSRAILRHAPMNVVCVPPTPMKREAARIPQLKIVLVATDFSELGNRAVPYAYSLLREGGTVFLIHITPTISVLDPLPLNLESKIPAMLAEQTAQMGQAITKLQVLIPGEATRLGLASEPHVVESCDPAKAICQAAERFGADVICLGSRGRTGLSATVLGSVAQAVIAKSRRPVLVVRPPEV